MEKQELQLILGFFIYKFADSIKFVGNSTINTCGAFGHSQTGTELEKKKKKGHLTGLFPDVAEQ